MYPGIDLNLVSTYIYFSTTAVELCHSRMYRGFERKGGRVLC